MKNEYYAIEYYDDGKFGIYCLDKNGETKEETIYKFSFGKFVEGSGLYNLITTDTGDYYGKFSFDEVEIDEQGMAKMCSIHLLDDCGRPEDYDTIEELNRNRYTLCVDLLYLTKDASFYLSLVEHIYINFVTGQR